MNETQAKGSTQQRVNPRSAVPLSGVGLSINPMPVIAAKKYLGEHNSIERTPSVAGFVGGAEGIRTLTSALRSQYDSLSKASIAFKIPASSRILYAAIFSIVQYLCSGCCTVTA